MTSLVATRAQQLIGKDEAERLFSSAVKLFGLESPLRDSDLASWEFCYEDFSKHLCTSASLLHVQQLYAQAGEEFGRGTNSDDFITLFVAGNLREAIVGGSSSIDDFVEEGRAMLARAGTNRGIGVQICYVVPNPEMFERMIPGFPEYAPVIVSMTTAPNRFSPNARMGKERLVSGVIVKPSDLARELSLMASHVLSGSEGGYHQLRATLADYLVGYLAPQLESLQQPIRIRR